MFQHGNFWGACLLRLPFSQFNLRTFLDSTHRESGNWSPQKLVVFFIIKIAFAMYKMHINVNFCLKFIRTHNTVSHAEIAQSTELSQHVNTVCAGHSKERWVSILDSTFFFIFGLHTSVLSRQFGWTPRLNYTMPLLYASVNKELLTSWQSSYHSSIDLRQ